MQCKAFNFPIQMTLLGLTASICQCLYAETGSTEPVLLPTIQIEVTRTNTAWLNTPASVYRIEPDKNKNNVGVNLTETLKGVPGLQLNNRENYAQDLQLSMRGFGARSTFGVRGIRLYVDGIPATMPDGQGQTSNIDLSSLSHIEVLGGPFSSLYGNSSGGAILTSTKEGSGQDSIELGYSAGSHNKNRADVILQGGAKNAGEPSYVVSSSYFDTEGYREHSAAKKVLSNAKLTWDLEDGSKVNWILNHVDINADDPGGLKRTDWETNPQQVVSNVTKYDARKEINQTQTGVTWTKPLNDQHELYVMAYMGQRSVTQYQSTPSSSQILDSVNEKEKPYQAGGVIDFDRTFYGTDLRWTAKSLLQNTRFTAGLAFDLMDEDRQGFNNFTASENGVKGDLRRDENNTLWNLDPYVQASWNFLPAWTVDAGLRYSNVHYESKDHYVIGGNLDNSGKTDYSKALPSVALSWTITPNVSSYISYAKGFETPTFTEMAYSPVGESQSNNLGLSPASSDNYELGIKAQNTWGNFTAAIFQSKTQNDIVSAGTENGRATFRNADRTLREGAELSWNKALWRDLTAQASYSYIDATFDAFVPEITNPSDPTKPKAVAIPSGNSIPGIAKNQAFVAVGWQPETGFNAGVDIRYMDKVYVDDVNSDVAPSYTVVSANAGYVWTQADWKVRTYVRADNLFDENYIGSVIVNDGNGRFFEPADGMNWSAGFSVTKVF